MKSGGKGVFCMEPYLPSACVHFLYKIHLRDSEISQLGKCILRYDVHFHQNGLESLTNLGLL